MFSVSVLAFLAGLFRHQIIAEHRACLRDGVLRAVGQMHAALEAILENPFAAAAGMDLAFHHHAAIALGK